MRINPGVSRGPLCCHLYRDGVEIGREIILTRRVAHPNWGGWLVLESAGKRNQGVWTAGRCDSTPRNHARVLARAHRLVDPHSAVDFDATTPRHHCATCVCAEAAS